MTSTPITAASGLAGQLRKIRNLAQPFFLPSIRQPAGSFQGCYLRCCSVSVALCFSP